jgi:hypothetical protein
VRGVTLAVAALGVLFGSPCGCTDQRLLATVLGITLAWPNPPATIR